MPAPKDPEKYKEFCEKQRIATKKKWQDPEYIAKQNAKMFGRGTDKYQSKEQHIKKGITRHNRHVSGELVNWNKGQTKETNESIRKQSESSKGRKQSEETKEKIRQKRLENWQNPEYREKMKLTGFGTSEMNKHSKESIEKQKISFKKSYEEGKWSHPLKGQSKETHPGLKAASEKLTGRKIPQEYIERSKEGIRKKYESGYVNPFKGKHHTEESKMKQQKSFIETMEKNDWMSLPERISREKLESAGYFTIPQYVYKYKSYDIFLPEFHLFIEIDGTVWHNKGIKTEDLINKDDIKYRKNDYMKNNLALNNGYRLLRIWEDELDKLENLINNKFLGLEYLEISEFNKDNYFEKAA